MARILKIDQFSKSNPSIYGIDTGFCYEVTEEFYIQIISEYKDNGKIMGLPCLEPVWIRIKTQKGDIILASKRSCFINPVNTEGVIECRPEGFSSGEEPGFYRFPTEKLKKIGREVIEIKPLGKEEKDKITISREL